MMGESTYAILVIFVTLQFIETIYGDRYVGTCPGPCGGNSHCHMEGEYAICECYPGFYGDPEGYCSQMDGQVQAEQIVVGAGGDNSTFRVDCETEHFAFYVRSKDSAEAIITLKHNIGKGRQEDTLQILIGSKGNTESSMTFNGVNRATQSTPNILSNTDLKLFIVTWRAGRYAAWQQGDNAPAFLSWHNPDHPLRFELVGGGTTPGAQIQFSFYPPTTFCSTKPCGTYGECSHVGCRPMCFCMQGYVGTPPNCVLNKDPDPCENNPCEGNGKCTVRNKFATCGCDTSEDCSPRHHCDQGKCQDPCTTTCDSTKGTLCHVAGHVAECLCQKGYFGDPAVECLKLNPCEKDVCVDNGLCTAKNGYATCGCSDNSVCSSQRKCRDGKCVDACPGECRTTNNVECIVIDHEPVCVCRQGFLGDPNVLCTASDPCQPDPCHGNGECSAPTGRVQCNCTSDKECTSQDRCDVAGACTDACAGECTGKNVVCYVKDHKPICDCLQGYFGDPTEECKEIDPCQKNPCAGNGMCSGAGGVASCYCMEHKDCTSQYRCHKGSCVEACHKLICNATQGFVCVVDKHKPVCACPVGFYQDPIRGCLTTDACQNDPCEGNGICTVVRGAASCNCTSDADCSAQRKCAQGHCVEVCPGACDVNMNVQCNVKYHMEECSCKLGYFGDPAVSCNETTPCCKDPCAGKGLCTPVAGVASCGCTSDADCAGTDACSADGKCVYVCPGVCKEGNGVHCLALKHQATCVCLQGYYLNANGECVPTDPCVPDPCKDNGICEVRHGVAVCTCKSNANCSTGRRCHPVNGTCVDACPGPCDTIKNVKCFVVDHEPVCDCCQGQEGNPTKMCLKTKPKTCEPPCNGRGKCVIEEGVAKCVCHSNADCPVATYCDSVSSTCMDVCPGPCLEQNNVVCYAKERKPRCDCLQGYFGDPNVTCDAINICSADPCHNHGRCVPKRGVATCVCNTSSDCADTDECDYNGRCMHVCPNQCKNDPNEVCIAADHKATCQCRNGYVKNQWKKCVVLDVCAGQPCQGNGKCIPDKHGYASCICTTDHDCSDSRLCVDRKCQEVCPGKCTTDSRLMCYAQDHRDKCICELGFSASANGTCDKIDPCKDEPCGKNAICTELFGTMAMCSCKEYYTGHPPDCSVGEDQCKENNPCNGNGICVMEGPAAICTCNKNEDCDAKHECVDEQCVEACPGPCGTDNLCSVDNHKPVCTCPSGFSSNFHMKCDFLLCKRRPTPIQEVPREAGPRPTFKCTHYNEEWEYSTYWKRWICCAHTRKRLATCQ